MNRRDAIKALTALPGLSSIQVADLKPGDVIVVECDDANLTRAEIFDIQDTIQKIWPEHRVMTVGPWIKLKVVRGE